MGEFDDYGLRYLIEHLIRAERPVDALSVIKPDLREAKRRRFGSDFGFVRDLEIVINYLEDRGQLEDLPATIRCSLIYSLLTSLVQRIPPEVLAMLVWFGESDRATELARLSPDSEDKAMQLVAVAEALRQSGANTETTKQVLQEALQIIRSLTRAAKETPDLLRAEIAKQTAHLDWEWCQQILAEIENLNLRVRSKIWVAAEVAEDEAKAIGVLHTVMPNITEDSPLIWDFSAALAQVAQHHLEVVQTLIEAIPGQRHQDLIRREVAEHLLENGNIRPALSVVEKIEVPIEPMTVIGGIIGALVEQNVEEAYRLLDDLSLAKGDIRPLLNFIEALSPEHVEYALKTASRIVDPTKKCQALAQIALLYARTHNITEACTHLKAVYDIIHQLPSSDITPVFLHITIGEIIAEMAQIDEQIATKMIAEWEATELGQYIVSHACQHLLDRDIGLTLRMAELIAHPYLKGIRLARAIFRLSTDDSHISTLREQIRKLAKNEALTEEQVRQLQAHLLVSEGLDTPKRLLSIWQNETEPSKQEVGLPTEIIINSSGGADPADEKTKQRDNILIDLALNVTHTNVDQGLIVLQAVHPANRTRGLAQLAQILNKRIELGSLDMEGHSHLSRRKNSFSDDVFAGVAQLAKQDVQLASKIVEALPNRLDQAKAHAAIALALKDQADKGQLFKERAILVSQTPPAVGLKAIAYLELDKCIPETEQEIDFVQKALSSLPVNDSPDVVPELTRHLVIHLAAKGKEEIALCVAKDMPANHAVHDTPDKVRALLEVAETAIKNMKMDIGKEALDVALNTLRLTTYTLSSLPKLASLMHTYDPKLAERLFDDAVEIAMDREMFGPPRVQILRNVAYFQASYNTIAALGAARKISDPYERADALMSVVSRDVLSVDETREVVTEVKRLLADVSDNATAKARTLLKLMDINVPDQLEPHELLWDAVKTARLAQPAYWYERIGFLIEAHRRFEDLGDENSAEEALSEALEVAQNDPFHRSEGMVHIARVYLDHNRSKSLAILYEILRRARLDSYDATWTAVTVIISILCELGGTALARCIHEELNKAEEFVQTQPL